MGLLYFDGLRQALDQAQAPVPFARRYIYHTGTKRLAAVYEDTGLIPAASMRDSFGIPFRSSP